MTHSQRLLPPTALLVSVDCSAEKTWRLARLHHHYFEQTFGRGAALFLIAMALIGADVAQAQEGPFIYVPNLNSNDVSVIDTPTNTVAPATIPVGLVAAGRGRAG